MCLTNAFRSFKCCFAFLLTCDWAKCEGLNVNNMEMGQVVKATKHEPAWLKLTKLCAALICFAVSIFIAVFNFERSANVNMIQDNCIGILNGTGAISKEYLCADSILYDWSWY